MRLLSFIPGALMFLLLPLGSMAKKTRQGSSGMLETLQADGDFGILVQAALSAGLGGYLNQLEGVPVSKCNYSTLLYSTLYYTIL